ncbi:hypothetical protein [Methanoculleus sp. MH98A]|uniref:hypothetical protein n=1 Tax=Methanoculleus sp. MH98A TaxID=1495314 RepID=UPI0004A04893|nr:hypothetical protein [Methanoculleus sp. MH98A]KDE54428.1 hypothetical protein EI28_01875 [Methanoculleus sp. MH98A]
MSQERDSSLGSSPGFFLATGVNADPTAILQRTLELTVEAVERISPDQDFTIYLQLFALASFITSAVALLEIVTLFNRWWAGAVLYAGGFIFGPLLITAIFC